MKHLCNFCTQRLNVNSIDVEAITAIIREILDDVGLMIGSIDYSFLGVVSDGLDLSTAAGPMWPGKKKREVISEATMQAEKKILNILHDPDFVQPSESGIAGRGKLTDRRKLADVSKAHGRLVRVVSFDDILIMNGPYQAILSYFKRIPEISIGDSHLKGGFTGLLEYFKYDGVQCTDLLGIGLDLVKYDASFPKELAGAIFAEFSKCFADVNQAQRIFSFIHRVHCDGWVRLKDSSVMIIDQGLASGATFVSIVESLALVAMLRYILRNLFSNIPNYRDGLLPLKVLGDDTWITDPSGLFSRFFKSDHEILDFLSLELNSKFCVKVSVDKSIICRGVRGYEYLGRKVYTKDVSRRDALENLYRWKYPEYPPRDAELSIWRCVGLLLDDPFSISAFVLLQYLRYMLEQHSHGTLAVAPPVRGHTAFARDLQAAGVPSLECLARKGAGEIFDFCVRLHSENSPLPLSSTWSRERSSLRPIDDARLPSSLLCCQSFDDLTTEWENFLHLRYGSEGVETSSWV
jgi:hypothetical protein